MEAVGSLMGTELCIKTCGILRLPPKVRVFGWKLAREGLTTQENKKSRKLCGTATCQICGMEDETGFHAVVSSSLAVMIG
jgi:hypothetical protein